MNPRYYRVLDCLDYNKINEQILSFVTANNLLDSEKFWNHVNVIDFVKSTPLLTKYLRGINLSLRDVAVTVGKNPGCCVLHTDTPPAKIKLNWPVMNTKNTYTRWFHLKVDSPTVIVNDLGGVSYNNYSELEEVERVELVQPCLIDATVPHDVLIEDTATFPRVGLQCMFFNEPRNLYE